jgi:hypothetical protein
MKPAASIFLVRHPPPDPFESMPGYVLRLSEVNGYSSMRSIFSLAGIQPNERAWATFAYTKLARVVDCAPEMLERIAFQRRDDGQRTRRVLGHPVRVDDLSLVHARVCPDCVRELGIIEAQWQLGLFIGCPLHKKIASYFCGRCRKRLTWVRPGMLTCRCGARITDLNQSKLSRGEADLLALLWAKISNEKFPVGLADDFPRSCLMKMQLEEVLVLIRFLGTKRLEADQKYRPYYEKDIFKEAVKVLQDWPMGFQKLLRDLCPALGLITVPRLMPDPHVVEQVVRVSQDTKYKRIAVVEAEAIIEGMLSTVVDHA